MCISRLKIFRNYIPDSGEHLLWQTARYRKHLFWCMVSFVWSPVGEKVVGCEQDNLGSRRALFSLCNPGVMCPQLSGCSFLHLVSEDNDVCTSATLPAKKLPYEQASPISNTSVVNHSNISTNYINSCFCRG